MLIQKDGKALENFSGTIKCKKVVIIDGKIINIITKESRPWYWARQEYDGRTILQFVTPKNGTKTS